MTDHNITDYSAIAEQYQQSKQQPWRTYVECFSLMEFIGDTVGQTVLDLACGEGFYTRMIRLRGADQVTGVDLSPAMIELARSQEVRQPLGVRYAVADARKFSSIEHVDLTVAAYLLNYARNHEELQEMCDAIARSLKPGGRFVTVNTNPALDFPTAPSYRKYGFETTVVGDWNEGTPINWTFHLSDEAITIENYHLDIATHEKALSKAGFTQVRWLPAKLSPDAMLHHDREFWSTLLDFPPMTFIECVK